MDFQPVFMSGYSLRDRDKSHWEHKVRPRVVSREKPTCSVCDFVAETDRKLIHADEVWSFPEPPRVILVNVRPLCVRCHEAKDYADLLRRIKQGLAGASRAELIINHYCQINECTPNDFNVDLKIAFAAKKDLEERYNCNCRVEVDDDCWGRPTDKPLLSKNQKQQLKSVFEYMDEPIIVRNVRYSSYNSAVRQLQSLPVSLRSSIITEIIDTAENDRGESEAMSERDEGIEFS